MAMAEIANHAGKEPWPSLDWASWIFDRASWLLVGSLIVGAAATITIVWMGIVKEHHWDLARESAGEKIASLALETARANEGTAKAHERAAALEVSAEQARAAIAGANARAAEAIQKAEEEKLARVKLESRLAPRSSLLDGAAISRGLAGLEKQQVTIVASPSTPESEMLARHLSPPLQRAGWDVEILPGTPTATLIWPTGIAIEFGVDLAKLGDHFSAADFSPAAARLADVLSAQGIAATAIPSPITKPNVLRIVITSRM